MDCTAARFRPSRRGRVWLWAAALLMVAGAGALRGEGTPGESAPLADKRAAALEQAFGPPCTETAPPPYPLQPPLDALYLRYGEARCLAAAGKLPRAAAAWQAGLDVPRAIPALWRWNLLQVQALAGDHDAALESLRALLAGRPDPILVDRARALVVALALEPAQVPPERSVAYLRTYLDGVTPSPADYDLLLGLLKRTPPEDGQRRAALTLGLWRHPKDATAAQSWAAPPGAAWPAGIAAPAAADYLARAERLFALRQHERLAEELDHPALPPLQGVHAKALGRLYFRALIRARALQRAAVQVNTGSVLRRFEFDQRQHLIWAIRIQLMRRRIGSVLKDLEQLERIAPKDPELPAIYYELLRYNQGRHDAVTVSHWLERIVTEYGTTEEASNAYWGVVWAAIERRALDAALPLLERAIQQGETFHPVDQARLYYWKGRLQALQGDPQAGAATWREMTRRFPYGYYTVLAEWIAEGDKLTLVSGRDGSKPPTAPPLPRIAALWQIEPFPQALFAFAVGEADLGQSMLRDAVGRPMAQEAVEEAGALFHSIERHHLQLRLIANHHLDKMRQSEVEDSPFWRRAFPRPHWELVQRLADEQQIDPYFVFAIMREESRFYTSANSQAGARGLMQLMPATARMMAKHNGIDYDEALLRTPEFNIPLGTSYLKRVLRRFDGNPVYAAAAYNAGPTQAGRWVRRYGKLSLDEFVERIPFEETQRYVKRVFLSYRIYTRLYR